MNRLENVRRYVDHMLFQLDGDPCRNGFVHLYGVSGFATLLARKRGIDEELAAVCGMLHDIASYTTGNARDHAVPSAALAQRILAEEGSFILEEIHAVCTAISLHSNKRAIDDPLDELLKDADVLQHHFYNPSLPKNSGEADRLHRCLAELAIE